MVDAAKEIAADTAVKEEAATTPVTVPQTREGCAAPLATMSLIMGQGMLLTRCAPHGTRCASVLEQSVAMTQPMN